MFEAQCEMASDIPAQGQMRSAKCRIKKHSSLSTQFDIRTIKVRSAQWRGYSDFERDAKSEMRNVCLARRVRLSWVEVAPQGRSGDCVASYGVSAVAIRRLWGDLVA